MTLQITRIQTYAWHNFLQQDLTIKGGDLFCIGASETGKTTLLDSLQVLLSGDFDTQWNSAANPTISKTALKEGGRSLHDILVREQDDGSRLRPDGVSIGYFAVELRDDSTGAVLSLALGARTHGHDSTHVEKWWLIAPKPLAEVKFTAQANGTPELLDKDLFRQANGDHVYDTHRYRVRLVREFFPELQTVSTDAAMEHLGRWTSFLNIGKSYGRLKDQSIDDLIRKALPEPRLEAFEEAKKGLGEIQSIRSKLDDARKQLESLQTILGDLTSARRNLLTLHITQYARDVHAHEGIKAKQTALMTRHREQAAIAEAAHRKVLALETQIDAARQRLTAILDPSKVALTQQYEHMRTRHEDSAKACVDLDARRKDTQGRADALETQIKRLRLELQDAKRTVKARILSIAGNAPDEVSPSITAYADAIDGDDESGIEATRGRLTRDASEAQSSLAVAIAEIRREQTALDEQAKALEAEAKTLKSSASVSPLEELADALPIVGNRATPLYLGVEVKSGQERTATLLQEFLGPHILGALVPTQSDNVGRLRTAVHSKHPSILVVETADLPNASILAGPLACIDVERSNPDVVRFLASEYGDVALLEPGVDRDEHERVIWRDGTVYTGRTWRIEPGKDLRFLGQKAREAARQARILEIDAALKEAGKVREKLATKQASLTLKQASIQTAAADAISAYNGAKLSARRQQITLKEQTYQPLLEALAEAKRLLADEEARKEILAGEVQKLHAAIKVSGADKMLAERDRIDASIREHEKNRGDDASTESKASARSSDAREEARKLDGNLSDAFRRVTDSRQAILAIRSVSLEEFDALVQEDGALQMNESSLSGRHTRVSGELGKHREAVNRNVMALPQSENMVFDEDKLIVKATNSMMTLEERIKQLAEATKTERERQQQRIAQIYTDQVVNPIGPMLKTDLDLMHELIRGINTQLKGIPFNTRTYQLHSARLRGVSTELVSLIEEYTPTNVAPLQDFLQRKFLDEQTSVEELQQMFDYRKWYSFTLQRTKAGSTEFADASSMSSSGGAQAAPHYILVYAMLRLLYETTRSRLRIILLDEAFRGVDAGNKPVLYAMGKELGLTLVVANTEFEGHSTMKSTADILMFTKNQHSETFIQPWTQWSHVTKLAG